MAIRALLERQNRADDRRLSRRQRLRLVAEGSTSSTGAAEVVIHDLSSTGLLLETAAALSIGQDLELDLPEGRAMATIIWNSGRFFGCKFKRRLSAAVVSAALLRSPGPSTANPSASMIEMQALSASVRQLDAELDRLADHLEVQRSSRLRRREIIHARTVLYEPAADSEEVPQPGPTAGAARDEEAGSRVRGLAIAVVLSTALWLLIFLLAIYLLRW